MSPEFSHITGKHRSKIGAWQTPSPATIESVETLNWHSLVPGDLAVSEWQAAGLELPDLTHIRHYRLGRMRHVTSPTNKRPREQKPLKTRSDQPNPHATQSASNYGRHCTS